MRGVCPWVLGGPFHEIASAPGISGPGRGDLCPGTRPGTEPAKEDRQQGDPDRGRCRPQGTNPGPAICRVRAVPPQAQAAPGTQPQARRPGTCQGPAEGTG